MTQKLSEAIRAGSRRRPMVTGRLFGPTEHGEVGSCALGAAAEGCGLDVRGLDHHDVIEALSGLYPVLSEQRDWYPLSPDGPGTLEEAITTAQDVHGMSREQIADILEGMGL